MDPPFWKSPPGMTDDYLDEIDIPYDVDTRYPRRTAKIKHCWCEANLDTNPWVPMTQFNPSLLPPEWNFLIDDNEASLNLTHLRMNNIKNENNEIIRKRKLDDTDITGDDYTKTDTVINKFNNTEQPLIFKMNTKKEEFYMTKDLYQ